MRGNLLGRATCHIVQKSNSKRVGPADLRQCRLHLAQRPTDRVKRWLMSCPHVLSQERVTFGAGHLSVTHTKASFM